MTYGRELVMIGSAVVGLAICLVLADQLGRDWIAFVGVGMLGLALLVRELTLWGSSRNAAIALGAILLVVAAAFVGERLFA